MVQDRKAKNAVSAAVTDTPSGDVRRTPSTATTAVRTPRAEQLAADAVPRRVLFLEALLQQPLHITLEPEDVVASEGHTICIPVTANKKCSAWTWSKEGDPSWSPPATQLRHALVGNKLPPQLGALPMLQLSTEKCQSSTEKCHFSTEKCQFSSLLRNAYARMHLSTWYGITK
jgi:hypothetical protein